MYLYFLFYTTMSECMIFYGPTVPEINYSILFYYSNGLKLYPFSGHSGFKVIHWETIVMKVHLMAM